MQEVSPELSLDQLRDVTGGVRIPYYPRSVTNRIRIAVLKIGTPHAYVGVDAMMKLMDPATAHDFYTKARGWLGKQSLGDRPMSITFGAYP
jgi:hypothetical protein